MNNNPWDLPDADDLPENKFVNYDSKSDHGYSMDTEKNDKDNEVSPEEMEKINKFLEELDRKNYPPNGPEDYIF